MHIYAGLIPDDFVRRFPGWEQADAAITLADYRAGYTGLAQTLSVAHLLWPTVVEDEGGVFIGRSYDPVLAADLRRKFGNDNRHVERWINAQELVDFFSGERVGHEPVLERTDLLTTFGQVLQHFWGLRLSMLFPERVFEFEVGDNLEGASGYAITVYER